MTTSEKNDRGEWGKDDWAAFVCRFVNACGKILQRRSPARSDLALNHAWTALKPLKLPTSFGNSWSTQCVCFYRIRMFF